VIAIVDYKAGNLTSVRLAFEAVNVPATVTDAADAVLAADRVVFPGVGAAGAAMQNLRRLGLVAALRAVVARGTPFLGICLGTQIIFERSEEDGGVEGIGLIPGVVRRFRPTDPADKVPQIGWNGVAFARSHPVFRGIEDQSEFYFVHSYYPAPSDPAFVIGETDYAGVRFAAIVGQGNLVATQFHPEKSGRIGLAIFKNFSQWDGRC
jgi:imidazole glycerol-phosphate synthase subunit HisH